MKRIRERRKIKTISPPRLDVEVHHAFIVGALSTLVIFPRFFFVFSCDSFPAPLQPFSLTHPILSLLHNISFPIQGKIHTNLCMTLALQTQPKHICAKPFEKLLSLLFLPNIPATSYRRCRHFSCSILLVSQLFCLYRRKCIRFRFTAAVLCHSLFRTGIPV